MDRPSKTLIDKLCARQKGGDTTDRDFAILLGVSAATWNLIRCDIKKPGLKFLAGVTRQYPDLMPDVMRFLQEEPGLMDMWSQAVPA